MSVPSQQKVHILQNSVKDSVNSETFKLETRDAPSAADLKDGEVIVKTTVLSNDPAQLIAMKEGVVSASNSGLWNDLTVYSTDFTPRPTSKVLQSTPRSWERSWSPSPRSGRREMWSWEAVHGQSTTCSPTLGHFPSSRCKCQQTQT